MICPHCQRTIAEQDRYLMSVDPDAPGWDGLLNGERGPGARQLVIFALALLTMLAILGLTQL